MAFQNKDTAPKRKSTLREYTESLAIALILAFIIKTSLVEAYKIPSGSMEDTLLVGDFLLANKFIYGAKIPLFDIRLPAVREPRPGDVIIFKFPLNQKQNYIKRLIATQGQTVEIRDKHLFVDGKEVLLPDRGKFTDENIIIVKAGENGRDNFGPVKVPPGKLFVMGDNRDNSYDSRFWGFLDRRLVQGKAMVLHWSWEPDPDESQNGTAAGAQEAARKEMNRSFIAKVFSKIGTFAYDIVRIPWKVRWERVGDIIR
jgi:signal peptidase I